MERIDTLLHKYVKSINDCDLETAAEIWDKEGSVSLIHPNGSEYSFAEIKEHFYLEKLGKFSQRKIVLKDIMTKFYGQTAFLEFCWDFYATEKDSAENICISARETQFIVLRDDGWKISNLHYSIIK